MMIIKLSEKSLSLWSNMYYRRGLLLVLALLFMVLVVKWWHWQNDAQMKLVQEQASYQALQSIIRQLPSVSPIVSDGDAMMEIVTRHPLPSALQGKVSDMRLVNNRLKANIREADAVLLFVWIAELEQLGLLVSQLELVQTQAGIVSGSMTWGEL